MGRKFVIGIQANADAGKTTLTEQLLYLASGIRKRGSVDDGTTASDFLEVEKRRGISVRTSLLELHYAGNVVRILDTPGHLDFAGEVLRSLYALDGVVLLISASDGAEGRTQTICVALRKLGIPFIACINKTDLPGFSREDSLSDLTEKLGGVFVPQETGFGEEAYLMPKPCWAIVRLRVEPLPPGSGIQFESVIKEKELPYRYQEHVRESVYKTVQQGLFGWEVMDCRFTLVGGMSHHVHTHPLDFFVATPIAVLRALQNAGEVLYEPWMRMELSAKEEHLGRVTGQILRMNGSFETPVMEKGGFTMTAEAPLRECASYPVEFRSLTSGNGRIGMHLLEYRKAPPEVVETFPRRGVDPLDRAKWILACRSALGSDLTGR